MSKSKKATKKAEKKSTGKRISILEKTSQNCQTQKGLATEIKSDYNLYQKEGK